MKTLSFFCQKYWPYKCPECNEEKTVAIERKYAEDDPYPDPEEPENTYFDWEVITFQCEMCGHIWQDLYCSAG